MNVFTKDGPKARQRLVELEEEVRTLDPCTDRYWAMLPERNALRDLVDIEWRSVRGYGARRGRSAPLPWPDDTHSRWRALRVYIEDYCGVRLTDVQDGGTPGRYSREVQAIYGPLGLSVGEWVRLVDEVAEQKAWFHLFRDSIAFQTVREEFFSLMIQGEEDYHWTVALDELEQDDPAVHAFYYDYDTGVFKPEGKSGQYGPYGCYRRVTDFVRGMLDTYSPELRPHERLLSGTMPKATGQVWAIPLRRMTEHRCTNRALPSSSTSNLEG